MFFQFLSIPIESSQYDTGVVTATHHYARTDAIQIGYAGKETIAAVGACIAPVFGIAASRDVIGSIKSLAGKSGEYSQIFVTFQNTSLTGEFVLLFVEYTGFAIVGFGVAYHFPFPVYSTVRSTCHHFRFPVTI